MWGGSNTRLKWITLVPVGSGFWSYTPPRKWLVMTWSLYVLPSSVFSFKFKINLNIQQPVVIKLMLRGRPVNIKSHRLKRRWQKCVVVWNYCLLMIFVPVCVLSFICIRIIFLWFFIWALLFRLKSLLISCSLLEPCQWTKALIVS